jgi:hypothetical protein
VILLSFPRVYLPSSLPSSLPFLMAVNLVTPSSYVLPSPLSLSESSTDTSHSVPESMTEQLHMLVDQPLGRHAPVDATVSGPPASEQLVAPGCNATNPTALGGGSSAPNASQRTNKKRSASPRRKDARTPSDEPQADPFTEASLAFARQSARNHKSVHCPHKDTHYDYSHGNRESFS